jgi:hypothetical protein
MQTALILLALFVTGVFGLIWLINILYGMAMSAARVDIGRELETCCAYLSRQQEARAAPQEAARMVLAGRVIDGSTVARKLEGE